MIIQVNFETFQKALKDFKTIAAKSPLASSEDSKDMGGLITAAAGIIKLEVAIKGFYMSSVVTGTVTEEGSVIARVDSLTSLKSTIGDATLTCSPGDTVMKLKAGRFKADIPVQHSVDDIIAQRPAVLPTSHSIHANKLSSAIKCVDLESSKDDVIFARFVFSTAGLVVWANSPSTAALYRNKKSSFEEELNIVLPVNFLVSYLSRVSGKVELAVDDSVFQLISDEICVTHPIREADIFDIKSTIDDILVGDDVLTKFSCIISDAVAAISSVSGFAPEDFRMTVTVDQKKSLFYCKSSSPAGEGENSFAIADPEGKNTKPVTCPLNCKVVLKLMDTIKSLNSDEVTWYILADRVLLQSKDETVNYVCAHME